MTRRDLPPETTRALLADRRSDAAADLPRKVTQAHHDAWLAEAVVELHRLESWRSRIDYVRDLATSYGIPPCDTRVAGGWRLHLFGRTGFSTAGEAGALSNWAQAVMKEFPEEARP